MRQQLWVFAGEESGCGESANFWVRVSQQRDELRDIMLGPNQLTDETRILRVHCLHVTPAGRAKTFWLAVAAELTGKEVREFASEVLQVLASFRRLGGE